MKIELASYNDIEGIIEVLRERVEWLKTNKIRQWGDYYVRDKYNHEYFCKAMNEHQLYVLKSKDEVVGVFLLKGSDEVYWQDGAKAYYIHHLAVKVGYKGLGKEMLDFIFKKAKEDGKDFVRLDCKKDNDMLNKYYQNIGFCYKGSGEEPYSYNLYEKKI